MALLCGGLMAVAFFASSIAAAQPADAWDAYWRAAGQARARGEYAQAAKLFSAALAVAEARVNAPDERLIKSLVGLAGVYRTLRREPAAESLLRRAIDVAERLSGPRHPAVASLLDDHAAVLRSLGRANEAAAQEERLSAILAHPSVQRPSTRWERPGTAESDLEADEDACGREAWFGASVHGPLIDPDRFTRCIERRGWRPVPRLWGADGRTQ